MITEDCKSRAPKKLALAVVTVSDTRTETNDSSGHLIVKLMQQAGHKSVRKSIVKAEVAEIQRVLREILEDPRVQVAIVNGGTGLAKRDVTIDAVAHFEEKPLPGFGELFRLLSYDEIGSAAMLSRSTAFVSEGKIVFCIPGSEKAVELAVKKLIIPEVGHLVFDANR